MWGVGGVVGSLVFARMMRWPLRILLGIGSLAIGAAYFGLAAAPSLGLACVAGVVGGIGNGVQWPSMISAVQALTPPDLHGRLMGAAESLGSLCVGLGLPLGGGLVALTSPRTAFVIVGSGAVLGTIGLAGVQTGGARASSTYADAPSAGTPRDESRGGCRRRPPARAYDRLIESVRLSVPYSDRRLPPTPADAGDWT